MKRDIKKTSGDAKHVQSQILTVKAYLYQFFFFKFIHVIIKKLSLLKRETAHVPIRVFNKNDIMNKNMKNNKLSFKYLIGRHAIKNNKKKLINANFELNNYEILKYLYLKCH